MFGPTKMFVPFFLLLSNLVFCNPITSTAVSTSNNNIETTLNVSLLKRAEMADASADDKKAADDKKTDTPAADDKKAGDAPPADDKKADTAAANDKKAGDAPPADDKKADTAAADEPAADEDQKESKGDDEETSSSDSKNPFVGATMYVNPEFVSLIKGSIKKDKTISKAAGVVMKQPTAIWVDTIANLKRVKTALPAAAKMAKPGKPVVITFVVYDLPGRDCHAMASNGEIKTGEMKKYKQKYIDAFATILKTNKNPNVRIALIIEPDSLPNLVTNLKTTPKCQKAEDDYYEGVAYALATLGSIPNTYMYLDAGYGGWLGWENNAVASVEVFEKAIKMAKKQNPKLNLVGFSTSVSNYAPFKVKNGTTPASKDCPEPLEVNNGSPVCQGNAAIDEDNYTKILAKSFKTAGLPTRFVVDTSRSGQSGIRKIWGSWCNVKGAGIGPRPKVNPAPLLDAFLWIKPPGESDGVSGPTGAPRLDGFCDPSTPDGLDSLDGAPQAGQWFHKGFVMLVKNANPPLK